MHLTSLRLVPKLAPSTGLVRAFSVLSIQSSPAAQTKSKTKSTKKKSVSQVTEPKHTSRKKALTPEEKREVAFKELAAQVGKLPKKPKKPSSAFGTLVQERTVGKKMVKVDEEMQEAARIWAGMSPSEKAVYEDARAKKMVQYKKNMETWYNSLTEQDIQIYNRYRRMSKSRGRRISPLPFKGTVQRPLNSFMRYYTEQLKHTLAQGSVAECSNLAREAGKAWRALSPSEKKPYEDAAKADMEKYHKARAALA